MGSESLPVGMTQMLKEVAIDKKAWEGWKILRNIQDFAFIMKTPRLMVSVGHTTSDGQSGSTQHNSIWATFNPPGPGGARFENDLDFKFGFCRTDGSLFPVKSIQSIRLSAIFACLEKATKPQFRSVILCLFAQKGYLQGVTLSSVFSKHFKEACLIAAKEVHRITPAHGPASLTQSTATKDMKASANVRVISVLSDSSQISAEGMENLLVDDAHSNKRNQDADDFAEYQKFTKRIRKSANAENDVLQAEVHRLNEYVKELESDQNTSRSLLDEAKSKKRDLENDIERREADKTKMQAEFEEASQAQQKVIEQLQAETEELRAFKQRMKDMF